MKACPVTTIRDRLLLQSLIRHSRHPFVNPAPNRHSGEGRNPEGVGRRKTTRRWKKLTRRPIFIFLCGLRKAMVIPAIGSMPRTPIRGRNPGGGVWVENHPQTPPPPDAPNLHTLVCRHQPAWTIGMAPLRVRPRRPLRCECCQYSRSIPQPRLPASGCARSSAPPVPFR